MSIANRTGWRIVGAQLLWLVLGSVPADAATPLTEIIVSPDITGVLGAVTIADNEIGSDDLQGNVTLLSLGNLPARSDVAGYHRYLDGQQLFALKATTELPGGVTIRAGDVVRYDGSSYAIEFDATAAGLPAALGVDAVSAVGAAELLLSFDSTFDLGNITVQDEDLVLWDGSEFVLFFDGSAAGVPAELNLDAAHYLEPLNRLLVSFDTGGTVGGVSFHDEDLLEFDAEGGSWATAYDGSTFHADWFPADLDAAYAEPLGAGAVPDGVTVPGVALTVQRNGAEVSLNWGASCSGTDTDYAVYEGTIGDFTSHEPLASLSCSTGGQTSAVFTPGTGNHYYLVVPQGQVLEGSYGVDSQAAERLPSLVQCRPQQATACFGP